jgi:sulfite oxidase
LKIHPGGSDKIKMAAGGAIEPFWEMYPFHKKDEIKKLLTPY